MTRNAIAAGALGTVFGAVVLSMMGSFGGPFDSSIGPSVLVNSQALGECTSALYYTQRRFNSQCWECNPILQAIGGPAGAWTYCGTPYVPFSARSLQDPSGSGTPAGVTFDARNAGTHYTVLSDLVVSVEEVPGACSGGGCAPGTHAIVEITQENHEDGGHRTIGVGRIPCTAPIDYCVSTNPNPRNGCDSDAGIWGFVEPETINGHLHFEIRADGGQCSRFGVYRLTGYAMPFAYGDAGGA